MPNRLIACSLGFALLGACGERAPPVQAPRSIDVSALTPLNDDALRVLVRGATIKDPDEPAYMTTRYTCGSGQIVNGGTAPFEGSYTIADGVVCNLPGDARQCRRFYQVGDDLYINDPSRPGDESRAFLIEVVRRVSCD
jgi:hypothetical protein